jgi:hypothetical protein
MRKGSAGEGTSNTYARANTARSTKQAIAIDLSKVHRAGVPLKAPEKDIASERTRRSAKRELAIGQGKRKTRAPLGMAATRNHQGIAEGIQGHRLASCGLAPGKNRSAPPAFDRRKRKTAQRGA